jgi:hypothetical protein
MKTGQELQITIRARYERMWANHERIDAKMDAATSTIQERMETTITSICSEFEETTDTRVEGVRASVDQWIQSIHKEFNAYTKGTWHYSQEAKVPDQLAGASSPQLTTMGTGNFTRWQRRAPVTSEITASMNPTKRMTKAQEMNRSQRERGDHQRRWPRSSHSTS